jgi:protein-arginine kinase activator protein McsA
MRNKAFLAEEDGKYYYAYELTHLSKSHSVPTRHRILYMVRNAFSSISLWIGKFYRESAEQRVKSEEFDYIVDGLIRDAEDECTKLCQHCGNDFNEFTKMCETQGWYMYVCERCAIASGMTYRMGDSMYLEGKKVERENTESEDDKVIQK